MPGKLIKASVLYAMMALVGANKVHRIDLERKIINHHANLQLESRTDIDLVIENADNSPLDVNENVLLDSDQLNYSQLRELQRRNSGLDLKNDTPIKLAQSK